MLLAVLPVHAFGWTWFHSFFWQEGWTLAVQAWKEILLVGLSGLAVLQLWRLWRVGQLKEFLCSRSASFWLALAVLLLATIYLLFGPGSLTGRVLGWRTLVLLPLAFVLTQFFYFSDSVKAKLQNIFFCTAAVVIGFALCQKFLLPTDFLTHFGYSANPSSWLPGGNLPAYHLVGESQTIRSQSFFSGPNQLAAWLLLVLPLTFGKWRDTRHWQYLALLLAGVLVLIFTFSRSAWLGALTITAVWGVWQLWRVGRSQRLMILTLVLVGSLATMALAWQSPTWQAILIRQASTSEHLAKSLAAWQLVQESPLGLGLGSTAGASQRLAGDTAAGLTPENTYLGLALELGWLGASLFVVWLVVLGSELTRVARPLAAGLLGIMIVMLLLHPLEDAPLAITLGVLAGMALHSRWQQTTKP